MITYEYECSDCDNKLEIGQSIKDKPISLCNKCGNNTLSRVISGGISPIVKQEPKTLGQLADRNTKKMGKYELQEKRINHKKSEKNARIRAIEESGGTHIDKNSVEHNPIYGKPDYDKINKMNITQQERFIKQGK
jgi:putative FmdB family regulatory protein